MVFFGSPLKHGIIFGFKTDSRLIKPPQCTDLASEEDEEDEEDELEDDDDAAEEDLDLDLDLVEDLVFNLFLNISLRSDSPRLKLLQFKTKLLKNN